MNLQSYDHGLVVRSLAYDVAIFNSFAHCIFYMDLGSPVDLS